MPYVGRLENRTSYDTFGRVWTSTTPSVESRFAFTGRDRDPESDIYHYRGRYYDPATGQFISADPIGFEAGDGNLYRYVGNGPTHATDPSGLIPFSPKLKLFTFTLYGREYTYEVAFHGPFPMPGISGAPREDRLAAESGLIRDFADKQKAKNSPLAVLGLFVVPAALLDGTIPNVIHETASDSRAAILVRIAQGDVGERAAGIVAYELAWVGEGFAQYGALESAVGPVRALPLAPKTGVLSAGERSLLARMIRDARSESFQRNARAAGFTEEHLKLLPRRLLEYGKAGSVHHTLSPVSSIGTDSIRISRFGTKGHVRHEMGHLLDEIKRPGLLAREGSLTYAETVTAERTASIVQLGGEGWRTLLIPHIAAVEAKTGVVTVISIGSAGWAGYALYDMLWGDQQ